VTRIPNSSGDWRDKIIADLRIAVDRNPNLRRTILHFWQLPPASPPEGADLEDDLRDVYLDNPELFDELIKSPAGGQTGPTGPQGGATGGQTGAIGTSPQAS